MKKKKQVTQRSQVNRSQYYLARQLPYLFFLLFLVMLYIGNAHRVERKVRDIDRVQKELKELNWIYMTLKSDVIDEGTYSRINKSVNQYQLSNRGPAPRKIQINQPSTQ